MRLLGSLLKCEDRLRLELILEGVPSCGRDPAVLESLLPCFRQCHQRRRSKTKFPALAAHPYPLHPKTRAIRFDAQKQPVPVEIFSRCPDSADELRGKGFFGSAVEVRHRNSSPHSSPNRDGTSMNNSRTWQTKKVGNHHIFQYSMDIPGARWNLAWRISGARGRAEGVRPPVLGVGSRWGAAQAARRRAVASASTVRLSRSVMTTP